MLRIPALILTLSLLGFYYQSPAQTVKSIEIDNTGGGLVLSRLSNQQRKAIADPPQGLLILNTDSGCLNYFYTPKWYQLCGDSTLQCNITADCPVGYDCLNNLCVKVVPSGCNGDDDCPPGKTCVGGLCQ